MALRLPPLSGLRPFEAAARCGSFKRAADELNLTPGALSHGIDSLEQWLDVELFERKARGVVLTQAGRQFLPYVSEALSMIATGTMRVPSRRFEDRLSISTTDLFTCQFLMPRLHKFQEIHPNIVVTVDASRQVVPLPSDQFDLAIRSGRKPWPNLSCELLGQISLVPVGTPHYVHDLSRGGSLDWSRATRIQVTPTVHEDWDEWETYSSKVQIDTSAARKMVVGTSKMALEAATGGLGIAMGRSPLIDDDLASRRLVVATDCAVPAPTGYWLVKPAGIEPRREIVAFRNWLLEEISRLKWNTQSDPAAKVASSISL